MIAFAEHLITTGHAYVDNQNTNKIRTNHSTLKEPDKNSPYHNHSAEENINLFKRMQKGEFTDDAHILRAKIDMASPNINLRDPTIYRIRHTTHHNTDDK